jgi:hypothetical protein
VAGAGQWRWVVAGGWAIARAEGAIGRANFGAADGYRRESEGGFGIGKALGAGSHSQRAGWFTAARSLLSPGETRRIDVCEGCLGASGVMFEAEKMI